MGTTAEKINRLTQTKSDLKTVINYTGVNITDETTFKEYPKKLHKAYIDILNNGTDDLYDALPKTTGTGSDLTLNTEEGKMKITLKGDTQQNGTPTPDIPQDIHVVTGNNNLKIVGKNLFDKNNNVIDKAYLPANTSNTKIMPITTTAYTSKILVVKLEEGKVYTIQKIASARFRFGFTTTSNPALNTENVITSRLANADTSSNVTFTVPNGSPYFVCNFFAGDQSADAQKGYDTIVNTVQIEAGSQATEYVEYQEQNYPISLSSKNLFDYTQIPDAPSLEGFQNSKKLAFKVKPNTKYTLSSNVPQDESTLLYFNGTSTATNGVWLNNPKTMTSDSNGELFVATFTNRPYYDDIINNTYYIQLEEGEIPTTYEPYYNLEYCNIADYTDQFFKNTTDNPYYDSTLLENEWYLKKNIVKYIFEGNTSIDNYIFNADLANVLAVNLVPKKVDQAVIRKNNKYNLYSDKFYYINSTSNIEHVHITGATQIPDGFYGNIRLYINHERLSGYSSSLTNDQKRDLVISWLQQNNLIVYYMAKNPNNIHISEEDYSTLKAQLEDIYNNVKSYEDKTYITQTNDDLPFNLDISALAEIE